MIYSLIKDKAAIRKIFILETLNRGGEMVTSNTLAKQLDCSARTIINDIYQLKSEIPKNWKIRSVKIKGYVLIKPITESILPIIHSYLSESVIYKIMLGIFNNKYYTLEKWSQILFMDTTTLRRHKKEYSKTLSKCKLGVKSRELKLHGNEMNIRYYYITFFKGTEKFVNQEALPSELRKKLHSILYRNGIQFDYTLLRSIIFVVINRIFNKHYVNEEIKFNPILTSNELNCYSEIIVVIESYYGIKLSKTEKATLNLFFFLGATNVIPPQRDQRDLIIEYLSKCHSEIYRSYVLLIDGLSIENRFSNELKEKLKFELISYWYKIFIMNELNFPISYVFNSEKAISNSLKKNYKKNISLVSQWDKIFNDKKFNKEEKEYIAACVTKIISYNTNIRAINILFLFTGTPLEEDLIYIKLQQNLKMNVKIYKNIDSAVEFNLIISNYQIEDNSIPVIYISDNLSRIEVDSIENFILGID
ncbi:hypothetical protein IEQ_05114 [Bacillus cereus BAG6X1-2]|nr:hypothetical protein IEQ_05114 [Bacillus cereus BAG6X1-2]